jgi:hypothetical protein
VDGKVLPGLKTFTCVWMSPTGHQPGAPVGQALTRPWGPEGLEARSHQPLVFAHCPLKAHPLPKGSAQGHSKDLALHGWKTVQFYTTKELPWAGEAPVMPSLGL